MTWPRKIQDVNEQYLMIWTTWLTDKEILEPLAPIVALVLWYLKDWHIYYSRLRKLLQFIHLFPCSVSGIFLLSFFHVCGGWWHLTPWVLKSLPVFCSPWGHLYLYFKKKILAFTVSKIFTACLNLQLLKILCTT